jgi:hypothetical protein
MPDRDLAIWGTYFVPGSALNIWAGARSQWTSGSQVTFAEALFSYVADLEAHVSPDFYRSSFAKDLQFRFKEHRLYNFMSALQHYNRRKDDDLGLLLRGNLPDWARIGRAGGLYFEKERNKPRLLDMRASEWPEWRFTDEDRFAIPEEAEAQVSVLAELLADTEVIESALVLERWLDALIHNDVCLPRGLSSDSSALAILKRLLVLDFDRGFHYVQKLIRKVVSPPFTLNRFRLSIVGALLNSCRDARVARKINDWVQKEVIYRRKRIRRKNSTELALLAGLLALEFISSENTFSVARRFEKTFLACKASIRSTEEQRFFLQLFSDTLSQCVTAVNFSEHLIKIIVLCQYLGNDKLVVWPRAGILAIIRDHLVTPVEEAVKQ